MPFFSPGSLPPCKRQHLFQQISGRCVFTAFIRFGMKSIINYLTICRHQESPLLIGGQIRPVPKLSRISGTMKQTRNDTDVQP